MNDNKYSVRLDICTICGINCPTCWMRLFNYGELGAGYTKFETYKKFIDMNKNKICSIEISNSGEALLNPDLIDILRYSYENNIMVTIGNGTTFNNLTDEKIKALVDYGVNYVSIAIDGVRQENYEKYRRNGDVNKVFENIKKLIEYKKEKNSSLPSIKWQYVIMESSEDDIELAIEKSKELDIPISFKLTWDRDYVAKDPERIKQLTGLPAVSRREFAATTGHSYRAEQRCRQLWNTITINWDGRVLSCCTDKHPKNLNAFEIPLDEIYNSTELTNNRLYLTNRLDDESVEVSCKNCGVGKRVISESGGVNLEYALQFENRYKNN